MDFWISNCARNLRVFGDVWIPRLRFKYDDLAWAKIDADKDFATKYVKKDMLWCGTSVVMLERCITRGYANLFPIFYKCIEKFIVYIKVSFRMYTRGCIEIEFTPGAYGSHDNYIPLNFHLETEEFHMIREKMIDMGFQCVESDHLRDVFEYHPNGMFGALFE